MLSLKFEKFDSEQQLCEFVNKNPYVQIISINKNGINSQYVLFYKEEEID